MIEEDPTGKRPLGRLKLRWKDCAKKDAKKIQPEIRWRDAAEDMEKWKVLCLAEWS